MSCYMYMGLEYFFSYVPLIIFILFYSVTEGSMKFKKNFLLISSMFNALCYWQFTHSLWLTQFPC